MSEDRSGEYGSGGLVLKDSSGAVYFVRAEVLAAGLVDGKYREIVEEAMSSNSSTEGEAEGFSVTFAEGEDVRIMGAVGSVFPHFADFETANRIHEIASSTVMCPW